MELDSTEQYEQKNRSSKTLLKRFTKTIVCLILIMVLVILAVLLLYAVNLYNMQHMPNLNELLVRAKLAKFPESIRNLQVDMRPYMDDDLGRAAPNRGELLVRFEAEPNDIESFINNSPGIVKNIIRPMGPISESEQVPTWWPTNESTDRRYIIAQPDGFIAVYDSSNTVRIWARFVVNPQIPKMQNATEDIYDESVDFLEDVLHEVMDIFD
jgi:hypothetical protein